MNSQVLQSYYAAALQAQAQLYGMAASPTAPSPYQYLGYMPAPAPAVTPTAVLPPAQQQITGPPPPFVQQPAQHVTAPPPFVHHPTAAAQIQGSFVPLPSLPHNFRLQLPPNAMSILPPTPTGMWSGLILFKLFTGLFKRIIYSMLRNIHFLEKNYFTTLLFKLLKLFYVYYFLRFSM